MPRIVCLASGGGRTILNFLDRMESGRLEGSIPLVITNRQCDAVERLRARGAVVEIVAWDKATTAGDWAARVWPMIRGVGAELVCNCGFLRLLEVAPGWEGRIMNIHPALLPKFGGKGMYGDRVHRAVLDSGETESGCTVHFVTNEYDAGPIIRQERVEVRPDDDVDSLAARVFVAECEAYPEAIRLFGDGRLRIEGGEVIVS